MARLRLNPIMTSDTLPSGVASISPAGGTAWLGLDGDAATSADVSPTGGAGSYLQYDFGAPIEVHGFRFTTKDAAAFNYPATCRLQWFEEPGFWNNIVVSALSGLTQGETSADQVGTPATAQIFRLYTNTINVEGGGADELFYGEVELLGEDIPVAVEPVPTPQSFAIYRAVLTGAEDATTDLEILTNNIQIRRREVDPTFVQVVSVDPSQAAGIAARPNGQLVISAGLHYPETGLETLNEIARGTLARVDTSKGAANESIVLIGYGALTASIPKAVTLTGVGFYASGTSGTRARGAMDSTVRPGDTVSIVSEGVSFVVSEIVYQIGQDLVEMEVQE